MTIEPVITTLEPNPWKVADAQEVTGLLVTIIVGNGSRITPVTVAVGDGLCIVTTLSVKVAASFGWPLIAVRSA